MSPLQFWTGSAGAGLLALLVLAALTGSVFVALVPAGRGRARFRVSTSPRRRRVRLHAVQAAWPDGLRDLVASIAAGRSLTQAVSALATTGPAPLREAFEQFPEWARVLGTVAALELVTRRPGRPYERPGHRGAVARARAGRCRRAHDPRRSRRRDDARSQAARRDRNRRARDADQRAGRGGAALARARGVDRAGGAVPRRSTARVAVS